MIQKCPNCKKWPMDILKAEIREDELFLHVLCYSCGAEFAGSIPKERKEEEK